MLLMPTFSETTITLQGSKLYFLISILPNVLISLRIFIYDKNFMF